MRGQAEDLGLNLLDRKTRPDEVVDPVLIRDHRRALSRGRRLRPCVHEPFTGCSAHWLLGRTFVVQLFIHWSAAYGTASTSWVHPRRRPWAPTYRWKAPGCDRETFPTAMESCLILVRTPLLAQWLGSNRNGARRVLVQFWVGSKESISGLDLDLLMTRSRLGSDRLGAAGTFCLQGRVSERAAPPRARGATTQCCDTAVPEEASQSIDATSGSMRLCVSSKEPRISSYPAFVYRGLEQLVIGDSFGRFLSYRDASTDDSRLRPGMTTIAFPSTADRDVQAIGHGRSHQLRARFEFQASLPHGTSAGRLSRFVGGPCLWRGLVARVLRHSKQQICKPWARSPARVRIRKQQVLGSKRNAAASMTGDVSRMSRPTAAERASSTHEPCMDATRADPCVRAGIVSGAVVGSVIELKRFGVHD